MAWYIACQRHLQQLNERFHGSNLYENTWTAALTHYNSGLGSNYFAERRIEVFSRGYTVLPSFADLTCVPEDAMKSMDDGNVYFSNTANPSKGWGDTDQLFSEVLKTFPGEDILKEPEAGGRKLWNPIVNVGLEETDEG